MTRDIIVSIASYSDREMRRFLLKNESELASFLQHLDGKAYFVTSIDYIDGELETDPKEVFVQNPSLELGDKN